MWAAGRSDGRALGRSFQALALSSKELPLPPPCGVVCDTVVPSKKYVLGLPPVAGAELLKALGFSKRRAIKASFVLLVM